MFVLQTKLNPTAYTAMNPKNEHYEHCQTNKAWLTW